MLCSLTFLMAVSCETTEDTDNNASAETYVLKDVSVYRENSKPDKTMPIRFYSETPNVPYVGIIQYFKEFYNTDLTLAQVNGFNVFSKGNKEYIKVNAKDDILGIKDTFELGHHPDFKENTDKTYLHLDSQMQTSSYYKLIDLTKYEIKTYSDSSDSYIPFGMLNNLYGGIEGYNIGYNGNDIYVLDFYGELNNGEARGDEYFADSYYNYMTKDEPRKADLAKYSYNQLCFSFDNLRGYTTQLVFGDNNLVSLGLNTLLEQYYPGIKKLLLSTNKSDFEKGFLLLIGGLSDGGHTGPLSKNPPTMSYLEDMAKEGEFKDFINKFLTAASASTDKKAVLANARNASFGPDFEIGSYFYYKYDEATKTAYIGFDGFLYDTGNWDKYYKGDTTVLESMENEFSSKDTYAFVRKSLYNAQKDGAVNVVLDVSTNGGGSADALSGVFALFNGGKSNYYINDTISQFRQVKSFSIDVNLDGKYDEEDVKEINKFKFNYVVVSSSATFSSGNLFVSLMKEKGYKTVGEKSGGGSCAVVNEETAEGFIYRRSGYLCLCNVKGDNIDSGIDVDLYLVETVDNTKNYNKFYNFKVMADYISSLNK